MFVKGGGGGGGGLGNVLASLDEVVLVALGIYGM